MAALAQRMGKHDPLAANAPAAPPMLTSRAKYAVRASIVLAERHAGQGWSSAAELAETASVPRKFLEAILTQLRDAGIVESRRGPQGGHRLRLSPETVSMADVIRRIEGPLAMTPCASETRFGRCEDCPDFEQCRIRLIMRRARDAVAAVLEQCSLAELASASPAAAEILAQAELPPKRGAPG